MMTVMGTELNIENHNTFKCGAGQKRLQVQADDMGYFLENASAHQGWADSVTTLFNQKYLHQDEAAAIYTRIVKGLIPDLRPKSALIVQKNEIQLN
jgi:hypothetical protein